MVRVACVAAAAILAAATGSIVVSAKDAKDALAPDWFWPYPVARTKGGELGPDWFWKVGRPKTREQQLEERRRIRLLVFSGGDTWRQGVFAHDGFLWTPAGEGNDGFVVKAIVSTGVYRYRSGFLGNAEVYGWMTGGSVMPGVHFTRSGVTVTAFAGLDMQWHNLSLYDPGNALRGRHVGLRLAIDLWTEPVPDMMLAGSATLSTIGSSYALRLAAGWRLFDRFYLGPEAIAYGAANYQQHRIGAHMTGLRNELLGWKFEWQGGLGYAWDGDGESGPYARLGVLWRD
jgi:hypothetical protein